MISYRQADLLDHINPPVCAIHFIVEGNEKDLDEWSFSLFIEGNAFSSLKTSINTICELDASAYDWKSMRGQYTTPEIHTIPGSRMQLLIWINAGINKNDCGRLLGVICSKMGVRPNILWRTIDRIDTQTDGERIDDETFLLASVNLNQREIDAINNIQWSAE